MYLYHLFKYYIFATTFIYKLTNKSTNKIKSNINLTIFNNYFYFNMYYTLFLYQQSLNYPKKDLLRKLLHIFDMDLTF